MQLLNFDPENELEFAILDTKKGGRSISELLDALTTSILYASSKAEVMEDGSGFDPLLVGESTAPLVAVFSSLSRPTIHRHKAEYVLQINGMELFQRVPTGYGIALNPGYLTQLVISSNVVSDLKNRK